MPQCIPRSKRPCYSAVCPCSITPGYADVGYKAQPKLSFHTRPFQSANQPPARGEALARTVSSSAHIGLSCTPSHVSWDEHSPVRPHGHSSVLAALGFEKKHLLSDCPCLSTALARVSRGPGEGTVPMGSYLSMLSGWCARGRCMVR